MISFTGSTAVGEGIVKTAGIKRLSLELGGNGPLVVLNDADLDAAVDAAVFGSFFHAGQICMIANRLVVDLAVYDEFVSAFTGRVRDLRAGDPADPRTDIGPVINARQLSSVRNKAERAVSAGAKRVLDGDPSGPRYRNPRPHRRRRMPGPARSLRVGSASSGLVSAAAVIARAPSPRPGPSGAGRAVHRARRASAARTPASGR